jgi:uncharacterized protein (DUF433 family)
MNREYVEKRDGGYWVAGTRVSLDSIVYAFQRGASPESIQRSFPLLSLEQIYGAITFYLGHQHEVNSSLRQGEADFDDLRTKGRQANPALYDEPI